MGNVLFSSSFQPQPKKYRLVQLEKKKTIPTTSLKLSLSSEISPKVSPSLKHLLETMVCIFLDKTFVKVKLQV